MSSESRYAITSRLAQFLRKNGDKVINGSCKLSLTTSALCLLNTLFAEVLLFQDKLVLNSYSSSASDIYADVKFLYDFIKRTSSLKLFHGIQTLRGGVDLSHFSNLSTLELRKMPAHLIIGLESLSVQLKALIVSRSIYLLKEIFGVFLDEEKVLYSWKELKELNLAYNFLETLDYSLQCLPNIEVLDLSHNHINNVEAIEILRNLRFVNLSYNVLAKLPVFNVSSCRTLTKLYLRNNNLEDLDGVDCFFNLEELDVGYNLLTEYHVLSPLYNLKNLKVLNLEGNPLYFHNHHTTLVSNYINENALLGGFTLNCKRLSIPQLVQPVTYSEGEQRSHHQVSIITVLGDSESIVSIPNSTDHILNATEKNEKNFEDDSVSSITSTSGTEPLAAGTEKKEKPQKTPKIKKKVSKIRDMKFCETDGSEKSAKLTSSTGAEKSTIIKAREIIEKRRREQGELWLIPDHSFHRLMIPAPQVPSNTPVLSFSENPTYSEANIPTKNLDSCAAQVYSNSPFSNSPEIHTQPLSSVSNKKEMTEILDIAAENQSGNVNRKISRENDDIEILNPNCEVNCCIAEVHGTMCQDDLGECDIYKNEPSSDDEGYGGQNEWLDSEDECEDSIFFVERQDKLKTIQVSVNMGSNYIKEKDVTSAKVLDRLDLNCLKSIKRTTKEKDGVKCCEVQLEFDTVKSSRQKRLYRFFDSESAMVLSKRLQPFVEAKTLKDFTLGALECVKCSSQFSKQVAHKIRLKTKCPSDVPLSGYDSSKEYYQEATACPNCGSHILVEMQSIPLPGNFMSSSTQINCSKKASDKSDNLSIASSSSGRILADLYSSIKLSPVFKKQSVATANITQNTGTFHNQNRTEGKFLKFKKKIKGNKSLSKKKPSVTFYIEIPPSNWYDTEISNNDAGSSGTQMKRISSEGTIVSETSQSSIAVIPDTDVNLDTILERDSMNSISPPISQDNIYYKGNYVSKAEAPSEKFVQVTQNIQSQKYNFSEGTEDDNDFYSLTESSTDISAKNCKTNEVISSGSEKYKSPAKNSVTDKSNTGITIESKELEEVSNLLNILGEKRTITYETFSEINHHLKLHLEINVFSDKEQLEACLHTSIVPLSTGEEFSGLFAISSKKLYVIKFLPKYYQYLQSNKPMDKVIKVIYSTSLKNLSQVKIILGSQGMTVACGVNNHVFTLLIRDADICNTFSSLLSDFIQEHRTVCGKVEFLSSAEETLQLMNESVFSSTAESEEMPEILLHLFAFWCSSGIGGEDPSHPVCVIVTPEDIFVSKILYKKQDSFPDFSEFCAYHYSLISHQKLSDLVGLELKKDLRSVQISFDNESSPQGNCESEPWTLRMETKSALFSFVSALKNPWEEIFHVPLTLDFEKETK